MAPKEMVAMIREIKNKNEYSYRLLSEALDIGHASLQQWLSGKHLPSRTACRCFEKDMERTVYVGKWRSPLCKEDQKKKQ